MREVDKIIYYLEKIKNRCNRVSTCKNCVFNEDYSCGLVKAVRRLNTELAIEPLVWNIKAIKNILEEE